MKENEKTTTASKPTGAASILDKLKRALGTDGDFPARTQAVLKLKGMVNSPNTTVDQIAEIILTEVSLGTRILHLVNSAYYHGARKITTISEAIMRIGMHALSDLFSGMVLMQRFIPAAKRGGAFADNIKRSILTSLLAADLSDKLSVKQDKEQAYLAGSFFHLGFLLLAYYFPQVYDSAGQRAQARNQSVYQSIIELLGIQKVDLCLAVLNKLEIPEFYTENIIRAHQSFSGADGLTMADGLAYTLACAAALADTICDCESRSELDGKLLAFAALANLPLDRAQSALNSISEKFTHHCEVIDMGFLRLPEYLYPNDADEIEGKVVSAEQAAFQQALAELKRAASDNEPMSSILLLALESLIGGLRFDRAILLLFNAQRSELVGRMSIGSSFPKDVRSIRIALSSSELLPVKAAQSGNPERQGQPLFPDSVEHIAIPIGSGKRTLGILYADITAAKASGQQLDFELGGAVQSLMHHLDLALSSTV